MDISTVMALPALIPHLEAEGYHFVSMEDVIVVQYRTNSAGVMQALKH